MPSPGWHYRAAALSHRTGGRGHCYPRPCEAWERVGGRQARPGEGMGAKSLFYLPKFNSHPKNQGILNLDMKQIIKPLKTIKKMEEGYPVTIAAIGDSLTYGWLADKGYLDYLKEMLSLKYPNCRLNLINRGIPGDTAFGGLNRLENDVLKQKPDAVFIQFSLNDAFSGYSAAEFGKNIQEIIDRIKNSIEADVILITSIYLGYSAEGETADIYYNVLEKIAENNKIPIAKVHKYWEKHINNIAHFRTLIQSDLVHPNKDGYKLMAEAIMEIF
jgi:acyl-CoA thioesterase I